MQRIRTSLWIVPVIYLAVTVAVGYLVPHLDRTLGLLGGDHDPDSVRDVLSAIATGMMAFTGFVLTVVLLLVQFGSVQFGPRIVRWSRQDWLLKNALGVFVATFVYAVIALGQIGRGVRDAVPDVTFALAVVLLLTSLVVLFFLLDRISNVLRPAAVGQRISSRARVVLAEVYPDADDGRPPELWSPPTGLPVREVVLRRTYGATLVTANFDAVAEFADETGSVVEVVPAIGEHVRVGMVLMRVYGGQPHDLRRLEASVILGDERNFENDPSFAFRLLVDVGVKALSPAINDPSTAVQMLDWLSGLLRDAATRRLGEGFRRDGAGRVRVAYHTSTWEDLVALTFEEIMFYGRESIQVCRRLRAMLDALIAELPAHRLPPLVELRERLRQSVDLSFPLEGTRRTAHDGDRLGLGMARSDAAV
jgi:uncharacterized membrane protein